MSSGDEDILRRHFVAIATGEYDSPIWHRLKVDDEVDAVRRWLCSDHLATRRFELCYPELAKNPTKQQIRDALENPPVTEAWRDADAAVVFVTGHGEKVNNTHYLILKASDRTRIHKTAIRTADLVMWLAETRIKHLMVILDACYAGKVVGDIVQLDQEPPTTWLVLPSATKNQQAVLGALTAAVTAFLAELGTSEGEKYGGPRQMYLNVEDFLLGVQEKLGNGQSLKPLYGSQLRGPHVCLPNPHYRAAPVVDVANARHDLALPRQDLHTHWAPRARGVASDDQKGWLFTGRAELMRALIAAATGRPAATVITGGAGSGKSAALARLVTLSDPQFLDKYADAVAAIPSDLRPQPGAVDVAVLATGKLHTQVLAQICQALGVPAPVSNQAEPSVEERLAAWHTWLSAQQRPVTIVVDALDEATHPLVLVREVLARLESDPQKLRIRLLIGVRSLAASDDATDERTSSPDAAALANITEAALHADRIPVDEEPWWDQRDVIAYVDSILHHTDGSPYSRAQAEVTTAVAAALGEGAGRSFLIARIAASSLAARDTVVAADDPSWLAALDRGVLGVFRQDLHHSLPDPGDRHRAVILLRAVAFAHGAGLPWRNIWPLVGHAVDDDGGYYGDSDIAWLLASRLGAYLVTDCEDDTTVYRLFHDLLRAPLREGWRALLSTPTSSAVPSPIPHEPTDQAAVDAQICAVEARIARELASVDVPATVGCDRPPPAYIRRYLAEHAAAGSILNDRTIPDTFLPYLDPVRLRAAASALIRGQQPRSALPLLPVIRQVTHQWDWECPARNAAAISLHAALNQQPLSSPIGGPWHVRWATLPASNSEILTHRLDRIWALDTAVLPNGRVVAVTGDFEGTVRIWDLATGAPLGEPLTGHTRRVSVATAVLPDRRVVAVTAGSYGDATVRVWDLATGKPISGPLTGHIGGVAAVATAVLPDGRAVAVTTGGDETVRMWELPTGNPIGEPLTGHFRGAVIATTALPDRRVVAVTGGIGDGTVRVWDLATGTLIGGPLTGHTGGVAAVATAVLRDGRAVAVTTGGDKTARVWELPSGSPIGEPLTGHTRRVAVVATAVLPDGLVVAVTGDDDTMRVWDLATRTPMGEPLGGHPRGVRAVATAALPDRRVVAVTGGDDDSIRVWDLATSTAVDEPLSGHPRIVGAVATAVLPDGRVLAVTGGGYGDATVRVWDLYSGAPVGETLTGHTRGVSAVATAVLPDGRAIAVTGGGYGDATARVWDLSTCTPVGEPLAGHHRGVSAVATAILPDRRAVAITGGDDGTVRVWDLATSTIVGRPLIGHPDHVSAVATAVLPDGRVLAVTGGGYGDATARVWDLATGTVAGRLPSGHPDGVMAVATAVLPDGRVVTVTGGYDGIRMWDLSTCTPVGELLAGHHRGVSAVATAILPDRRAVAITADYGRTVWAWDLATGTPVGELLSAYSMTWDLAVHQGLTPWLVMGGTGIVVAELLHGQTAT